MSRPFVIFLIALLLSWISAGVLWITEIPLGIPGEWVWGRIPYESVDQWDAISCSLFCLLVGGVYTAFVRWGANRMEAASRRLRAGFLAGLVGFGFLWLFVVQLCLPAVYGISKSPWVLYYPMASGYFHEARFREETLSDYLANYETDIQSQDESRRVLHHGTHPPGLFVCYRGLMRLCESSPRFVQAILHTQPPSVAAMFDEIESRQRLIGKTLRECDRAVIWLATLLTQLCGAATVVPLFFLARTNASRKAAWIAAAFWPLVPAIAVFLPKSDVLYAFFGMLFLAVWWSGWRRNSLGRCVLAGGIFWLGLFLSLALLPVAFLAGILILWDVLFAGKDTESKPSVRQWVLRIGAGVIGFLLPCVFLWGTMGLNLAAVWWSNYQNHAEFYQHFQRSYLEWFWVNPVETLVALGAPIFVLAWAGVCQRGRDGQSSTRTDWGPVVAILITLGVLWISGKNRGEAARLWLVVFPCYLWLSARYWDRMDSTSVESSHPLRLMSAMLVLQMLVCWLTVCRVNGFPL